MQKHKQLVIHMANAHDSDVLNQIKKLVTANPGNAQVYLSIGQNGTGKTIKTKSQVRISQELLTALQQVPDVITITDSISNA